MRVTTPQLVALGLFGVACLAYAGFIGYQLLGIFRHMFKSIEKSEHPRAIRLIVWTTFIISVSIVAAGIIAPIWWFTHH